MTGVLLRSLGRTRYWLLVVTAAGLALGMLTAGVAATAEDYAAPAADRSPGASVAGVLSTVTGMAISPLLSTGVYGAYQWFTAKNEASRAALPWFAQIKFWLPALLLVGLCAAKDTFGAIVPTGLKKPLDILELIENKISGLIAAGAVMPLVMMALSKLWANRSAFSGIGFAPTGLAMLPQGMIPSSWLFLLVAIPIGLAVFVVVWMASHAVTALILLSPWGAIDAVLKVARTSLLGLLALAAMLNPWWGAALASMIIAVAFMISGWAFRLTVFGSQFCWDFATRRNRRFSPDENDNAMFAAGALSGVPIRTYGRLILRTAGAYEFIYRPWLWRSPRVAPVLASKGSIGVARGIFFSRIMHDATTTLFVLPPRYCGHEDVVQRAYLMGGGVYDAGLRKVWRGLKELILGTAEPSRLIS
jgi:hypothetical protein